MIDTMGHTLSLIGVECLVKMDYHQPEKDFGS